MIDEGDRRKIREARAEGVPTGQLAERYGVSRSNISMIAPTRRHARLSVDDKREIMAARREGVSCRELANRYGITPGYVSHLAPVRWDARPRTEGDRGCIIDHT